MGLTRTLKSSAPSGLHTCITRLSIQRFAILPNVTSCEPSVQVHEPEGNISRLYCNIECPLTQASWHKKNEPSQTHTVSLALVCSLNHISSPDKDDKEVMVLCITVLLSVGEQATHPFLRGQEVYERHKFPSQYLTD